MAYSVDIRGYAPLSAPNTLPVRAQKSVAAVAESPQKSARNFVESLPGDVRERIGQLYRDQKKEKTFERAERNREDQAAKTVQRESASDRSALKADFARPIYTKPIVSTDAALLQVQLSAQEYASRQTRVRTEQEHKAFHAAYLSAGAQPGGQAAAFQAQLKREELTQKTVIVPPVVTSVNLHA